MNHSDPTARLAAALADRYRLERELGAGGMATVYLAQDLKHDRKVAIKVLRPELAAVIGAERFLAEIKTTANLQHPHILPLFDSGAADSFLFYVMPFIDGESLRDRLNRGKQLPIGEAVRIATEVASALDYAHRHGVIHRDIKPENILLHDGRALVADFGIALAATKAGGGRMTQTGMSLGTPNYMSPEQAMGEREIGPESDVYALGALTYEMLAGEPPFTGPTAQAIIARVMTENPRPLAGQRKSVPPHVEAAVFTALEKLPADRYATAAEFAAALGHSSGTMAGTAATRRHFSTSSPRRFVTTAVCGVVLVLVALAAWFRPRAAQPVRRFSVSIPADQALGSPVDNRVALSPDGNRMVYRGAAGSVAGPGHLWLRSWSALKATPLPNTDGAFNPAFAPDGERIAFVAGAPRSIRVMSVDGGQPVTITDSLVDRGGVAWGKDGYIYYDAHFEGDGLARIPESGGNPERVTIPDTAGGEIYHVAPATLPSGKGLIFTVVRRGAQIIDNQIAVYNFKTRRHRVLVRGVVARFAPSGHLLYVTSDGILMAAPFDQERLVLTGPGVAVGEQLSIRGNSRVDLGVGANGILIYAAGAGISGNWELVWVDRAGIATSVDSEWSGYLGTPRLSPDGSKVAIVRLDGAAYNLYVKELDRGPASKLTSVGTRFPAWSADGKTIAFATSTDDAIWTTPADGSVLPSRYRTETARLGDMEYSADGGWLIYRRIAEIYAVRTHGDTTRHSLVVGSAVNLYPALSPDGRWLAYTSDETGRFEVYVRPFPDTRIAKQQVSVSGGSEPVWSRDGRELFFVNARNEMVVVPVRSGPTFTAGASRVLFAAEQYIRNGGGLGYDVSRDGRRFLMARPLGVNHPNSDELILIENFARDLGARVKK